MCSPLLGCSMPGRVRRRLEARSRAGKSSGLSARAREVRWGGIGCDPVKVLPSPVTDGVAFLIQYAQVPSRFAKKWPNDLRFCFRPRHRLSHGTTSAIATSGIVAGWHRRSDSWSSRPTSPARARHFWTELLDVELEERSDAEGVGWQTRGDGPALGVHPRGPGPGDRVSLPYFSVSDMESALTRVRELGGEVIHPGERWSVCRDSEGSPFGLAVDAPS
jgi:predicted enzyme related to lactoylglutathione lyase